MITNSKSKVFTLADVSPHNNSKDCWVIINASVYDVTDFLNNHPGGDNVLLDAAGKDASDEFEEVGHGSAARLMLDEYYVGEVDHVKPFFGNSKDMTPKLENDAKQQMVMNKGIELGLNVSTKLIGFLLSIPILGVGIAIYFGYILELVSELKTWAVKLCNSYLVIEEDTGVQLHRQVPNRRRVRLSDKQRIGVKE
ncbi:hypothetical protein LXL04_004051 [Taraxacum kok-saghyz]